MSKENTYKKIEKKLYSYNKTKCEINNLKIDIEELKDDVSIASTNFDSIDSGRCDSKGNSSKVEDEVIRREKRIAELEREIRRRERIIKKIDNALDLLNPEDKVFVQLRYFDDIPMPILARRYGVESVTLYKRKDAIIRGFINIL